jgi:uncharacterized protein
LQKDIENIETEEMEPRCKDYLASYASNYLREEVWAEQLVRKLDPFRKFLEVAAQSNGKLVNFSNIARDVGSEVKSIQNYFSILEDTLLGFFLEPFHFSARKRLRNSPKFFFFDVGVARQLSGFIDVNASPKTSYYGEIFEQWFITEIFRLVSYSRKATKLSYLQTASGVEVDLVIEQAGMPRKFIKIKSSTSVSKQDADNLMNFDKDFSEDDFYLISQDPVPKQFGRVRALNWQQAIREFF